MRINAWVYAILNGHLLSIKMQGDFAIPHLHLQMFVWVDIVFDGLNDYLSLKMAKIYNLRSDSFNHEESVHNWSNPSA